MLDRKMPKIIFIRRGGVSNTAPFNRFISIVKAVNLVGLSYEVLNIKPSFIQSNNNFEKIDQTKIMYDGIVVESIFSLEKINQNPFQKVIRRLKEKVYSYKAIERRSGNRKDIIYLYSTKITDYLFFFFLSRIFKFRYVHERSEYPKIIRNQNPIKVLFYKVFIISWCYKLFDGMVIMTEPLINFYSRFTRKDCKIIKIPMSVDADRFNLRINPDEKYIGYVGSLNIKKDGLDILIKAFGQICDEFPDYNLKIAGSTKFPEEIEYLKRLSDKLGLADRVQLLGGRTREQVPLFLCGASLLVLARPNSKQAEGGFPTKLGEYLATGNPVIVTDVGEISSYLKDGLNAYIIKPGEIEQLVIKLRLVLKNMTEAYKIGQEGKRTALAIFDYRSQSIMLKDFFDSK